MSMEHRIPFFVSIAVMIAMTMHAQLSIGYSILLFFANFLIALPFIPSIYPISMPLPAQYLSIAVIGVILIAITRSSLNKNIEIFLLNSKLKEAEKERFQTEKFAAIGVLAKGISHELNNILNNISVCARAAKNMIEKSDYAKSSDYLADIRGNCNAGGDLIKSLRYSSTIQDKNSDVELRKMVDTIFSLNKGLTMESFLIENSIDPDLVFTSEKLAIYMALSVVIVNAIEACESSSEKSIHVSAIRSGGAIEILVKDSGIGIVKENISLVFEEFSTKSMEWASDLNWQEISCVHSMAILKSRT